MSSCLLTTKHSEVWWISVLSSLDHEGFLCRHSNDSSCWYHAIAFRSHRYCLNSTCIFSWYRKLSECAHHVSSSGSCTNFHCDYVQMHSMSTHTTRPVKSSWVIVPQERFQLRTEDYIMRRKLSDFVLKLGL